MEDILTPTIFGYPITVWFIVFCLSVIGTVVFAVLVIVGFAKRKSNEAKIVEKVKNKSKAHEGGIDIPSISFDVSGRSGTESILGGTSSKTASFTVAEKSNVAKAGETESIVGDRPKFCPKCGNKVRANFCSRCGNRLN